jgi:hypothetical protein
MGIERLSVNVSDLRISRPSRRGPGGDESATATEIGANLEAAYTEAERIFRRGDGREVVAQGQFFIDPIRDNAGDIVPVLVGDLAEWTDHQGVAKTAQEIVRVAGIPDCTSRLDIVDFSVGQLAAAGP